MKADRMSQLIPLHVGTDAEIMELEHALALDTARWALVTRRKRDPLTVKFLTELHTRLFDGIWRWAGQLRRTDHPEGVRWPTIGIELNDLIGEARFWRDRKLYGAEELAVRFHHRLIRLRCWEGGNGRHGRLATDALVIHLGHSPFSWGRGRYAEPAETRERYSAALKMADTGEYHPLLEFARGK